MKKIFAVAGVVGMVGIGMICVGVAMKKRGAIYEK